MKRKAIAVHIVCLLFLLTSCAVATDGVFTPSVDPQGTQTETASPPSDPSPSPLTSPEEPEEVATPPEVDKNEVRLDLYSTVYQYVCDPICDMSNNPIGRTEGDTLVLDGDALDALKVLKYTYILEDGTYKILSIVEM